MQVTPTPTPRDDEPTTRPGVIAASPHLLDALEALSAMAALDPGTEPRFPLSDPLPCTPTITTTSASATTCKP